jgi:hypothetical protein
MSESRDLRPMPGWRNNSGKRLPMGKHPSISFAITTANSDRALLAWRRPVASSCSKLPFMPPELMRSVNGSPRSVRQACLDHLLILQEKQLQRVLNGSVAYFNRARPHQGIGQQLPEPSRSALSSHHAGERVIALPVMSGLHHDYHWAA